MLYDIFATATASQYIGQVEAESKIEAEQKAYKMFSQQCALHTNCHNEFDIGDAEMDVQECSD